MLMNDAPYPIWWDSTVTLYNKNTDKITQIVTWYKTVITNCFWKNSNNRITVGEVELQSNDVICRVPQNEKYLSKSQWVELPNDEKGNYFTLGKGDILIQGEIEDIIDEQVKGHRSTDLIAKYKELQGCIYIKQFSDNTGIGRVNPHYFISGV